MLKFLLELSKKNLKSLLWIVGSTATIIGGIWNFDLQKLTPSGTLEPNTLWELRILLTLLILLLFLLSLFILLLFYCYKNDLSNKEMTFKVVHEGNQPSNALTHETRYFTIGNYKWETIIYNDGTFEVEKYPFCIKHDLRFIFGRTEKYCPGSEEESCNNRLSEYDEFEVYEAAKSIIEKRVLASLKKISNMAHQKWR